MEIYLLLMLEIWCQESRRWQFSSVKRLQGESFLISSKLLLAPGSPWHFLVCSCVILIFAFIFTGPSFPYVSLCICAKSPFLSLIKTLTNKRTLSLFWVQDDFTGDPWLHYLCKGHFEVHCIHSLRGYILNIYSWETQFNLIQIPKKQTNTKLLITPFLLSKLYFFNWGNDI
jgi:hypothetical protein